MTEAIALGYCLCYGKVSEAEKACVLLHCKEGGKKEGQSCMQTNLQADCLSKTGGHASLALPYTVE